VCAAARHSMHQHAPAVHREAEVCTGMPKRVAASLGCKAVTAVAAVCLAFGSAAEAVLNLPNAQIARSPDAALRRATPAFNAEVKTVQRKLEDVQTLLRIPQRKPWGGMANDVSQAEVRPAPYVLPRRVHQVGDAHWHEPCSPQHCGGSVQQGRDLRYKCTLSSSKWRCVQPRDSCNCWSAPRSSESRLLQCWATTRSGRARHKFICECPGRSLLVFALFWHFVVRLLVSHRNRHLQCMICSGRLLVVLVDEQRSLPTCRHWWQQGLR
jgi:hypothetical protein